MPGPREGSPIGATPPSTAGPSAPYAGMPHDAGSPYDGVPDAPTGPDSDAEESGVADG